LVQLNDRKKPEWYDVMIFRYCVLSVDFIFYFDWSTLPLVVVFYQELFEVEVLE